MGWSAIFMKILWSGQSMHAGGGLSLNLDSRPPVRALGVSRKIEVRGGTSGLGRMALSLISAANHSTLLAPSLPNCSTTTPFLLRVAVCWNWR